uniref:Uncharacterized protein n=1 Tax=Trichinella nativa TaxID=6335 RepID=A0A0V1KIQ8_9BILA
MERKLTNEENEKLTWTWNMARNSEKHELEEIHTVGAGHWREK